ncbi:MAG: hypothetical protein KME08_15335 [Aphanothece sp. CMT-3BRIN-NPC111]|jgi:translation initiation factor 2 gamma subunit (eIF-2gamma)|nr:hypothetical protein [Aphanothece sp. CMT-3BRIN-NPC111]
MESFKEKENSSEIFPAKVVKVIDDNKIVINRGAIHGIKNGKRLLVYSIGEEIKDPNTEESLGYLEIVKGTGEVIHIQEKMSTIESDRRQSQSRIIKKRGIYGFGEEEIVEPQKNLLPFDNPEVGDMVKPI